MGNLLDRIGKADDEIGAHLDVLTFSISQFDMRQQTALASNGVRGRMIAALESATFRQSASDKTKDRYVFTRAVFGIQTGSAKTMSHAQCQGTLNWLINQGNSIIVPRVVALARELFGEAEVPLSKEERAAVAKAAAGDNLTAAKDVKPPIKRKETMSDQRAPKQHWLTGDTVSKFLQFVQDSGLDKKAVFSLFSQAKTKEEMRARMAQIVDALNPQKATHAEAKTVVFSDMYTPTGIKLAITARQGATSDDIIATAVAWDRAAQTLIECGWKVGYSGNGNGYRQPTAPAQPATTQPAVPAPAPQATAPPTQPTNGDKFFDTEFIKVGLTKANNPSVQFWRPGREFCEIAWSKKLDGLFEVAPWLSQRATQEQFSTVSTGDSKLDIKCRVYYTLSDRTNQSGHPYKDILRIEPR